MPVWDHGGGSVWHDERRRERRRERDQLEQAVRRAYRKITGEPEPIPISRRVEKKVKTQAIAELRAKGVRFDGIKDIQDTLAAIGLLMRELETGQARLDERADDEEAVLLLLLAA